MNLIQPLLRGRLLPYGAALFALFTLSGALASGSDQTAKEWLEKMVRAVNGFDYQGTFVYLHDNQLETMRIEHQVDGGRVKERLVSLNGAPREVIRDQDYVACVVPDSQQVSIDKRPLTKKFLALLPEDLRKLEAYYQFRWLGKGRVAGHNAKVVAIIPKDDLRYGYRFFLDEESGLPLKSDLMNEQGQAVEQTMFTQLDVGNIELPDFEQEISAMSHRTRLHETATETGTETSGEGIWSFRQLPAGFALSMRHRLPDPHGQAGIEQYVLSDGLASLSIFVEPTGRGESLKGASRLGAINAWGGEIAGHQVTAVGEVPAQTLLAVVEGMRLKGK